MARRFSRLTMLLAAGICLTLPAVATASDFVGNWFNIDADTAGITRIEIRQRPDRLEIHPFGRCHPQDCDWGTRTAELFTSHDSRQSAALRAEFGERGDRIATTVILRREQSMLRAETFTLFADERKPYWAVYHFKTKTPQSSAPVPALPLPQLPRR